MYELTYAERLRGRRFWLPLAGLLAATVVGLQLQASENAKPVASASPVLAAGNLDPSLRGVLTSLGASGLPCQAPTTPSSHKVTCNLGATPSAVTFQAYPSHRLALRALPAIEHTAGSRGANDVGFLVVGTRWVATGQWSQTGSYRSDTSPGAVVAERVSSQLAGCLELLPRQHGSCDY
jgi:hypothetical protein